MNLEDNVDMDGGYFKYFRDWYSGIFEVGSIFKYVVDSVE